MSAQEEPQVDPEPQYEALVKLQEVKVDDGEQNENVVYREKSALYRFDKSRNEWKERGKGDIRLLQDKTTGRIRLLLRQAKTQKVRLNHFVQPIVELKPNAGSDRSWTWSATDYSDEAPEIVVFAIRFRDADTANKFKDAYDSARKINGEEDAEKRERLPALTVVEEEPEETPAPAPEEAPATEEAAAPAEETTA